MMTRRAKAPTARQARCSDAFTGVGGRQKKSKGRDLDRTATRGGQVVRAAYPGRRLFEAGLLAVRAAARPWINRQGVSPDSRATAILARLVSLEFQGDEP